MTGVVPGLDHQFMDPFQFIIQGPIQCDDPRLDIHDEVAVWVTLTSVDFIEDQTIITIILICCKHLQRMKGRDFNYPGTSRLRAARVTLTSDYLTRLDLTWRMLLPCGRLSEIIAWYLL